MAMEIVQSLCPTRGYCKPIKHLFLLLYFLLYSLFFTESININENRREFSNNKCQVMHRCPRIDKGWERCRVFPPHPAPSQEAGVAGDPRVLQQCTHWHNPRQVPGLPCTAPSKDCAPTDVAEGETKTIPITRSGADIFFRSCEG